MGIDIKFPIGLMFTILGLLITIFGIMTNTDVPMYSRSLGININLWSGAGMLVFGIIMLVFSYLTSKAKK
jgi:purine-cytosine permease-like protein